MKTQNIATKEWNQFYNRKLLNKTNVATKK